MPIYEYACPKCDKLYEIIHKMGESPKIICDNCLVRLNKNMSASGFRLVGDGFYKPSRD